MREGADREREERERGRKDKRAPPSSCYWLTAFLLINIGKVEWLRHEKLNISQPLLDPNPELV